MSFSMNRRVFLKNGSLVFIGMAAFRSFGAYGFNEEGPHPIPANESLLLAQSDRIRFDSACLTIDGKDTFIYSGAFHYFRCPKELWRDRFKKIKEADFN